MGVTDVKEAMMNMDVSFAHCENGEYGASRVLIKNQSLSAMASTS